MDWQIILKRKIKNEVQYNNASPEERKRYHANLSEFYYARVKMLRQTIKNLDNTDPNAPILLELKENVEMSRFHRRQRGRLVQEANIPDVFSPELEQERKIIKPQTTDRGNRNFRPDLTLEEYQKLDKKQKLDYHMEKGRNSLNEEERKFHQRMRSRLRKNSKRPTFPTPDLGGESSHGITETKEEYDKMSREDKRKYHGKLARRIKINNNNVNNELSTFHSTMYARLHKNIPLPTFFSPEHQEEQ
tara:strand:+ start:2872 stop:3609 length:738 start_codon:yes stop_codon:yes gene_type:complete